MTVTMIVTTVKKGTRVPGTCTLVREVPGTTRFWTTEVPGTPLVRVVWGIHKIGE